MHLSETLLNLLLISSLTVQYYDFQKWPCVLRKLWLWFRLFFSSMLRPCCQTESLSPWAALHWAPECQRTKQNQGFYSSAGFLLVESFMHTAKAEQFPKKKGKCGKKNKKSAFIKRGKCAHISQKSDWRNTKTRHFYTFSLSLPSWNKKKKRENWPWPFHSLSATQEELPYSFEAGPRSRQLKPEVPTSCIIHPKWQPRLRELQSRRRVGTAEHTGTRGRNNLHPCAECR